MEELEKVGKMLVDVSDTLVRLSNSLSNLTLIVEEIGHRVVDLRTDVDKLIENQKGGVK